MNAHPVTPKAGVVLVAAGKGERIGAATPKQFLILDGHPVFSYSLRLFASMACVSQIALVLPAAGLPAGLERELEDLGKPLVCVRGGARRQDSVAAGLEALTEPYEVALVHDAARPFPDPAAVERLIMDAARIGGGLLAVPSADTVKRARPDGCVEVTIDRSTIWLAQTPQALRRDLVGRAIEAFRRPDFNVTDEAGLLEHWGLDVALVESNSHNFKITHPADLAVAGALLAFRKLQD